MNILSVQSWVSYGHVGNAAALFPLQRLGIEVWAVNTVQFSNHSGYGDWRGQVFTGEAIRDVLAGIEARGVLPACDGVLSGYLGDVGIGEAILDAVTKIKAANARALYCCDPVIGDLGSGVFVRPGIPEFMRERAVPAADVVTPNHFELEFLAGRAVRDAADLKAAVAAVHALGPRAILVTSLRLDDTPDDGIDLVASDTESLHRLRTPLLPIQANGAGDAIAALFFAHLLRTGSAAGALAMAGAAIFGLLRRTAEAGARELLVVAAQDEFVSPSAKFPVERLA